MTTIEGINEVLREAAENRLDDEGAFLAVKHKGWECVRPLISWYYRNLCRSRVRAIEQSVDEELALLTAPDDRIRAREILARETFALPDGTRVEWGRATAEQHLERARMQRRLAGDCIDDSKRHEQAAKEIRAAGVTCLDDLKRKHREAA
jgi:hypothetical protein